MSKKQDTAAALAGILKAKRGDESPAAPALPSRRRRSRSLPPPSPAPPPPLSCGIRAKSETPAAERPRRQEQRSKLQPVQRLPPQGHAQEGRPGFG